MFGRVLSFECKSYFRSKGFLALAAVLLVLLVGVTLGCRFSEEGGAGEVYGMEAYSSREELLGTHRGGQRAHRGARGMAAPFRGRSDRLLGGEEGYGDRTRPRAADALGDERSL